MKKIFLFFFVIFLFSLSGGEISAALQITTVSLPSVILGTAYDQQIQATGGFPPYTFSVSSGELPNGLNLSSSDGRITGTPTPIAAGAPQPITFDIRVVDTGSTIPVSKTFSIRIDINQLSFVNLTSDVLPPGILGEFYDFNFQAKDGIPPYRWENVILSNDIPQSGIAGFGLNLSSNGGKLSGTPNRAGNFRFGVRVSGSFRSGGMNTALKQFKISIQSVPFEITTPNISAGEVNVPYSAALSAHGGVPPYSWIIAAGSLPSGLIINSSQGIISGIPANAGTFSFTVLVRDSEGSELTKQFSIIINSSTTGSKPCSELGGSCCPSEKPTCTSGGISGASDCTGCCGNLNNCVTAGSATESFTANGKLELSWPKSPLGTELTENSGITVLIKYLYDWGISISGLLVFIVLVIAGFQYLASAGNPAMMRDALDRIKSAGLGLIMLLASVLILNTINPQLTIIKMPGFLINSETFNISFNLGKGQGDDCAQAELYSAADFDNLVWVLTMPSGEIKVEQNFGFTPIEINSVKIDGTNCQLTLYQNGNFASGLGNTPVSIAGSVNNMAVFGQNQFGSARLEVK